MHYLDDDCHRASKACGFSSHNCTSCEARDCLACLMMDGNDGKIFWLFGTALVSYLAVAQIVSRISVQTCVFKGSTTVLLPSPSWGQTDVFHHLHLTEPSASEVWLPLHQSVTHKPQTCCRRSQTNITHFITGNRPQHTNMDTALEAYLSHSDPRKRMQRSQMRCIPKAHQTRAHTNTKHAQHVQPTAQG